MKLLQKNKILCIVIILFIILIITTLFRAIHEPYKILIAIMFISLFCIVSFYKTILQQNNTEKMERFDNTLLILGSTLVRNTEVFREISINGTKYKENMCNSCNIFRSRNMFHCNKCEYCVLNHDHHCFWINNCIGEHNYNFFMYLINSTLLLLFYNVYRYPMPFDTILRTVIFLTFVSLLMLFALLCFYFWILKIFKISSRDFLKKRNDIRRGLIDFILKRKTRNKAKDKI